MRSILLCVLAITFSLNVFASGENRFKNSVIMYSPLSIGDSAAADSKALLDIKSTTKGVLWPRMTATQRAAISSPTNGLLVWDTTIKEPCQYDGSASAWECFPPGSTTGLGSLKVVETDSNGLLTGASSLGISLGGTGQTTKTAGFDALSPNTTKGDVTVFNGTNNVRLPIGTDGYVATADSTASTGISWKQAAGGGGGLNFVGLSTSFILSSQDDIGAETSVGNWATYADAAGTDPVDMTGGSATALTFSRTTTAGEVLDGSGSFKIVKAASNAQGMGAAVAVNIPPGYRGQNMQFTLPFKIISGSISSDDLKFEAYDVTNSALLSVSCNTGSSTDANQVYTAGTVLIICNGVIPSTTAQIRIGFHFATTSTTAVTFSYDDVYVAPPSNIGQVAQAQLLGTIKATGCAGDWSYSGGSFADPSTQASCVYTATGLASAPATNLPAIKLSNVPPGDLLIQAEGLFYCNGAGTCEAGYQFSDGTNQARELSQSYQTIGSGSVGQSTISQSISYTTAQSNLTLKIQGKVFAGNNGNIGASGSSLVIKVYYFPSSSQTVMNASQVGVSWSGTHGTDCNFPVNNTGSYADPSTDSTCTFTELTNHNFGTVTSYTSGGNKEPGIVFTPAGLHTYWACAEVQALTASTHWMSIRLTADGSTSIASQDAFGNSSTMGQGHLLCGMFSATSTGAITLRIQAVSDASGNNNIVQDLGFSNTVTWSIFDITASMPAPFVMNSVTSSSSGVQRIESIAFAGASDGSSACTSDPCTIVTNSESGSWASSVNRTSAGHYTVNISASEFKGTPTCTVSQNAAILGTAGECFYLHSSSSSTTAVIGCYNTNQTAGMDAAVDLICQGPH